jgi:hypothetical protein
MSATHERPDRTNVGTMADGRARKQGEIGKIQCTRVEMSSRQAIADHVSVVALLTGEPYHHKA